MPSCEVCHQCCKTAKGLKSHYKQRPECDRQLMKNKGMVLDSPPFASRPPKQAGKPPSTGKNQLRQVCVSEKEMNELIAKYRATVEEDNAAWQQIADQKVPEMEDDRKMPAVETVADQEDDGMVDLGHDSSTNEDEAQPDTTIGGTAGNVLEDWSLREQQLEEVRAFMNNPHGTLMNPYQGPPPELDTDFNNDQVINRQPNRQMRDEFRQYCDHARKHFRQQLDDDQRRAIKLLDILKRKKAPLNAYDAITDWHYRDMGVINAYQSVGDADGYISRTAIIDFLKERYLMTDKFPQNTDVLLPYSRAKVTITRHNAWDCIQSLLTDPRVEDTDYLFADGNPFAGPPTSGPIGELNTGRAYKFAYRKYITDPSRQILLPICMYIDGAVTGQFNDLPITALKIALGIHRREFRDNGYAWRSLGHVASVSKALSRGKRIYDRSGHLDSRIGDLMTGEGDQAVPESDTKAQDFHAMLDCILESYLEVQENGFVWDLRCGGRTYKDVEFVPFVIYVKCDTDEADLLCGSYQSRTGNVSQLCRYCTCPTQESDLVRANFPFKNVRMIQELVFQKKAEELRKLSQQNFNNAWYKVRFSPDFSSHNKPTRGIHGACPSEKLHAILLGVFKYTRDCFFEQMGKESHLASEINALAQKCGVLFGRQSERDMPECSFKKGIRKGKLMAKEFRGILLVMAAVIRSEQGRALLGQNENFNSKERLNDWQLLVEMLLEWEAYLSEEELEVGDVMRLQGKNRYIMYLMKKVARRSEGMGLKLMKFHAIVHLAWDIIMFGVPKEFDTGSNESQHKETKVAAKLTQRNETSFDFQTCTRLDEFLLVDLAVAELRGHQLWRYFDKSATKPPPDPPPDDTISTGGATINVFLDKKKDKKLSFSIGRKKPNVPSEVDWGAPVIGFLYDLKEKLGDVGASVTIRTEHKRKGQIFRGHPKYRDVEWKDWALFDWGKTTNPGQIWCFVVIEDLRQVVEHGGIEVKDGTYAVIESADYVQKKSEREKSDLFVPITKEVGQTQTAKKDWKRRFYLADVDAIVKPCVVVPNIGGRSRRDYLIVKQRDDWVKEFVCWVRDDKAKDTIGEEEPIPSHMKEPEPDQSSNKT